MNCKAYNEHIMKYMDKVITAAEQIELDKHLQECDACSLEFNELKSIVNVLEEESSVEPPEDFEDIVMKKINVLQIYNKKQREKRLLASYFVASIAFTVISLLLAVLFRENILGFMLAVGMPDWLAYTVYGFLTRIDLLIVYVVYGMTSLKIVFSDFYYLLIGLFVITLMSKMYEIKSIGSNNKATTVSLENVKK